jgi:hypothetical protein
MPRFTYFTSHSKEPVTAASLIWQESIPLRLDALLKNEGDSVSHADYYQAAQSFLENNSYDAIVRAVSRQLERDVKAPDIEEIRICLQKHGEFYHPARIEIVIFQKRLSLVLNVAISETGRRFIEKEYQHLKRLTTELRYHYLPQVYGFGCITGSNELNFAMFLGQWFEGYHEFHISIDPVDKKPKIMVWDDSRGRFFLTVEQTKTLYARASKILTDYYNLESFEQIFSWHHAAGDFIVKTEAEKLALRLVSVRQYASIFGNHKQSPTGQINSELILQALLVFFLNLSIHMRLDRLDGIGEMVWSDPLTVEASLIGFLEALSIKPDVPSLPDSALVCFIAYLTSCSQADLLDLSESIVKRFNPQMPGLTVVKKNIHQHVETLHGSIQQFLQSDSL